MSTKILSISLLLLSVCLCFQSSEGNRRFAGRFSPLRCCRRVTTADISTDVTGNTYLELSATPPCMKAVIFTTQLGEVCADPKTKWVQTLTANMTKL
ncbi:C-C motif chemokine 2-like [Enoplosus armatus]|uniref:C-C motif chemokine 2-like n=1 Tax=Enoplosus armatus TaxID=215367 RepID=UPI003996747F